MTFSSRLVGGAVGTSRAADKLTDTSKIGSGLADYGEDVIAPWLARTAQADHIGGKALRGLGWIGKQHSKIPGYDWMEGRLAQLGAGAAGALWATLAGDADFVNLPLTLPVDEPPICKLLGIIKAASATP